MGHGQARARRGLIVGDLRDRVAKQRSVLQQMPAQPVPRRLNKHNSNVQAVGFCRIVFGRGLPGFNDRRDAVRASMA